MFLVYFVLFVVYFQVVLGLHPNLG
jgi:hypothetical protein